MNEKKSQLDAGLSMFVAFSIWKFSGIQMKFSLNHIYRLVFLLLFVFDEKKILAENENHRTQNV